MTHTGRIVVTSAFIAVVSCVTSVSKYKEDTALLSNINRLLISMIICAQQRLAVPPFDVDVKEILGPYCQAKINRV